MRGFTKDAFERMNLRTTGMEFASEMVVKGTVLDMNIVEVPTTLSPDGRSRSPHLRTWRDGWRHLRFLLMYSPRWLFLYPGLLLTIFGGVASAWLLPRERSIGSIHLDVDTLLYTLACLLIGFHAVVFSVSAKVFAIAEGLLPEDPKFSRWFRYITLETGMLAGLVFLSTRPWRHNLRPGFVETSGLWPAFSPLDAPAYDAFGSSPDVKRRDILFQLLPEHVGTAEKECITYWLSLELRTHAGS